MGEHLNETRISKLTFGFLKPEEVRLRSVVEVKTDELYMQANVPHANGPLDLRMGTVDRRIRCATCGHGLIKCNGHEGFIDLGWPVYHYGMLPYVIRLLRACCFFCSRIAVPKDHSDPRVEKILKMPMGRARFMAMTTFARTGKCCIFCDGPRPKFKILKKLLSITADWSQAKPFNTEEQQQLASAPFTAREAYEILAGLTVGDCSLVGIDATKTHPKYYIMKVFSVPPPIMRPTIMVSGGSVSRSHDDLTKKISTVVNRSNIVRNSFVADVQSARQQHQGPHRLLASDVTPSSATVELIHKLQYHTSTFMNNEISGVKQDVQRSGVPIKGITERCKTKHGHIRGRMVGKRVDESARTVITGDPAMDVDEIGVPEHILNVLTFTEYVNTHNWHQLQQMCNNGKVTTVITKNGDKISVALGKDPVKLELGWKVKRNLRTGDYVLLNRQPTLHKKSMMAFRVRSMPHRTIRLNLAITTPYNADMDGDEMNLFGFLNVTDLAEGKELMTMDKQVLNAAANKPCIGLVQDGLSGSYMLTGKDAFLREDQMMSLRMELTSVIYNSNIDDYVMPPPTILKPKRLWTGKQAFSMLFPKFFTMVRCVRDLAPSSKTGEYTHKVLMDEDERFIQIKNGELFSGRLCKQMLGPTTGGIIHVFCNMPKVFGYEGGKLAVFFISDAQRLINKYMMMAGLSVGIGDCLVPEATKTTIAEAIKGTTDKLKQLKILRSSADLSAAEIEAATSRLLCNMTSVTGYIGKKSLPVDNPFLIMSASGAKGNVINLAQITACVGQQSIEGQRVGILEPGRQTLPSYSAEETSISKHGFIQNSYTTGLSPQEFFYHSMAGREGLSDTAVKTATTGYIQRRMIKAMEDMQVHHDGTVRNAEGYLVMHQYGDDGFDPALLEKWNCYFLKWSWPKLLGNLQLREEEYVPLARLVHFTRVRQLRAYNNSMTNVLRVPCNPTRLLIHAASMFGNSDDVVSSGVVWDSVRRFCRKVRNQLGAEQTLFIRLSVRGSFTQFAVCEKHKISRRGWDFAMTSLNESIQSARVNAGEMVGMLAAESIGSLVTQLTLNTFHYAGVAEHNTTLGVPRLTQLIDCSGREKYAEMTVALDPSVAFNRRKSQQIVDHLAILPLLSLVSHVTIEREPEVLSVPIEAAYANENERWVVAMDAKLCAPEDKERLAAGTECVIRMELRQALMRRHKVTPQDVCKSIIANQGKSKVHVVSSTAAMPRWFVRVRVTSILRKDLSYDEQHSLVHAEQAKMLSQVSLKGTGALMHAQLAERKSVFINHETGEVKHKKEHFIQTVGTCMRLIWNIEGVDWKRTISNDVHETIKVLGLEAGMSVLFREIKRVLSFDGTHIDDRHIALLINTMCFRGEIMPLTRHGINKVDVSVMCKVSFEEFMDVMLEAAAFGQSDPVKGATVNLMLGRRPFIGTGLSSVLPKKSAADTKTWLNADQDQRAGALVTAPMVPNKSSLLYSILRKDLRKFQSKVVFSGVMARLKPVAASHSSNNDHQSSSSSSSSSSGAKPSKAQLQIAHQRSQYSSEKHLSAENLNDAVERLCAQTTANYAVPNHIEANAQWEKSVHDVIEQQNQAFVTANSGINYFHAPESPEEQRQQAAREARQRAHATFNNEHVYFAAATDSEVYPPHPPSPSYIPNYHPTSPSYIPHSPIYHPTSPSYTPLSPSVPIPPSPSYPPTSPSIPIPPSPSFPAAANVNAASFSHRVAQYIPMQPEVRSFTQRPVVAVRPGSRATLLQPRQHPRKWRPSSPTMSPIQPLLNINAVAIQPVTTAADNESECSAVDMDLDINSDMLTSLIDALSAANEMGAAEL